jgi:hypothetical protein
MNAGITVLERMAGREHYRNSRLFLAGGGLIPLLDEIGMTLEDLKVVGGGTVGLHLLRR